MVCIPAHRVPPERPPHFRAMLAGDIGLTIPLEHMERIARLIEATKGHDQDEFHRGWKAASEMALLLLAREGAKP